MKTILVTAGGTIAEIDDVRYVGNFSSGSFPAKIAEAALESGYKVVFLHAKRSRQPFDDRQRISLQEAVNADQDKLELELNNITKWQKNLQSVEFTTFEEYASYLEEIIKGQKPEVVFLGAAVSDYTTIKADGKISSDRDELTIDLIKTPKIIRKVKEWANYPVFQVGFKLLSGVSDDELFNVAYKAGLTNQSNLTIANDLSQIRQGKRAAIMVTPEKGRVKFTEPDLAKKVFNFAEERFNEGFIKTTVEIDQDLTRKYSNDFAKMKTAIKTLYDAGLLEEFYDGSGLFHGSVSFRAPGGFLITGRASDKSSLADEDIVFVEHVDIDNNVVQAKSTHGNKPSMNAALSGLIFEKMPDINAIVHTHQEIVGKPATEFPYTPGTKEYSLAPLPILENSRTVNLINHGQLTVGQELEETVDYVKNHIK